MSRRMQFMIFFSFVTALVITSGFFVSVDVSAQDGPIQNGIEQVGNIGGGDLGTARLQDIIINIVNIALGFLGIIAVVIILYGGFLWMTSAGNQDRVARARRLLINAVIGLAIILSAWAITLFVLRSLSSSTGGNLCTPGEIRTFGPGDCGIQTCLPPGQWGARDASLCPGGSVGGGSFRVVNEFPRGNISAPLCVLISAEFNNEVDSTTVDGQVLLQECTGGNPADPCSRLSPPLTLGAVLAGSTSSQNSDGENSRFIEFNPSVDLRVNSTYRVELVSNAGTGIRSVDNENLGGNHSWIFSTGSTGDAVPPTVSLTDPANGDTNICLAKTIRVDFSEAMLRSSLIDNAAFSVSGTGAVPTFSRRMTSDNTTFSATPRALFQESSSYTPLLNGDVIRDACGNFLDGDGNGTEGGDYTWSFDTGTTPQCTPVITGVSGSGLYDTDTIPPSANVVTIEGNDFGTSIGEVTFENNVRSFSVNTCLSDASGDYQPTRTCRGDDSWWGPTEILTYIPADGGNSNGAVSGNVRVRNEDNNLTSNLVSFPIVSPHIDSLSTGRRVSGLPAAGVGQFMTVQGENFGTSQGGSDVYFVNSTDTSIRILSDIQCGVSGWTDDQIIISPPSTMPPPTPVGEEWVVQIWKDDGAGTIHRSNIAAFRYDDGAPGPGLCRLDPDAGPFGAAIFVIEGENFESFPDFPDLSSVAVAFGNDMSSIPAGGAPVISPFDNSPDEIKGITVPNIEPRNNVGVFISDGEVASNSLPFDVLATGNVPVILKFSPTEGGDGQYVTITGVDFGSGEGNVYLSINNIKDGSDIQIYNPALFPLQCQGGLWNDSQIIVKIPPNLSAFDYIIIVERAHDLALGTTGDLLPSVFSLDNAIAPTPGICLLEPANGNPGTSITIYGDNLGTVPDAVRFFNNNLATDIASWADTRVDVTVPDFSETGPLVVSKGGADSNPLLFSVGFCTDQGFVCGDGTSCCSTGAFSGQCRTDLPGGISACEGLANQCVQSWTFTTATGIGTSCDLDQSTPMCEPNFNRCGQSLVCDPTSCDCQQFRVVVNSSCAGVEQSPSPRNGQQDACVNSELNVRFNAEITQPPNDSIILEACNDPTCSGVLTPVPLLAPFTVYASSQFDPPLNDSIRVQLDSGILDPDRWYRAIVRGGPGGVLSATNLELAEHFSWLFKTRDNPEPCAAERCTLSPGERTVEFVGAPGDYILGEVFGACNLITTDDPYDVQSSDTSIATVAPAVINPPPQTTAFAVSQGIADITATNQIDTSVSCLSKFNVTSLIPEVVEHFPNCITACTNASMGARFNIGVRKANFIISSPQQPSDSVRLYSCGIDMNCTSPSQIVIDQRRVTFVDDPVHEDPSGGPNLYATQVDFGTPTPLQEDEYFQIEFQADQIFGASGESLRTNSTSTDGTYRWIFKTKVSDGTGLCSIDRISLVPEEITARFVGASHAYKGEAYSAPDDCSIRGQRLSATDFNWSDPADTVEGGWITDQINVAYIDRTGGGFSGLYDDIPPPAGDNKADPKQYTVTSGLDVSCNEGLCSTNVIGSVEPALGETAVRCTDEGSTCAVLSLQCGYNRDEQCSEAYPTGIGLGTSFGVSYTSCCSERPMIDSLLSRPFDGQTDFCRNGTPKIVFTKEIDTSSINGNIFLVKNIKNGTCPVGSSSLLVQSDSQVRLVRTIPTKGIVHRIAYWIETAFNALFGIHADAAYTVGDNLCLVRSSLSTRPADNGLRSEVVITPQFLLDTTEGFTEEYAIVVLGDDNRFDGAKAGVRSRDGVTFVGDTAVTRGGRTYMSEVISFDTKREICSIARIDHNFAKGPVLGPTPKMRPDTTERFFCAGDACQDDILDPMTGWAALATPNRDGNQHYLEVEALDAQGNTLNADFTYFESGPDFFNREEIQPMNEYESLITVDDALQGFGQDVRGSVTVRAENTANSGDILSKTLGIHLFNCHNPWPDIDTFPFVDDGSIGSPATNFEFYYCRDDGQPGTFDDLPALDTTPVAVGSTPTTVCYGGSRPTASCSGDAECTCFEGSTNCVRDGVCAAAGLKDIVFTREDIPNQPTLDSLSIPGTSMTGGEVRVSWSDTSGGGADGFKVYWGTDEGTYPFSIDVGRPPSLEAVILNLENGREYFFTVTAYVRNALGGAESRFSLPQSITVGDTVPPKAPAGFTSESVSPGIAALSWDRGRCSLSTAQSCTTPSPQCPAGESCVIDSDVSGYRLFIGTSSGSYLEVRDVGLTSGTSLNLASGVEYFFRLQAYDVSGNPAGTCSVTAGDSCFSSSDCPFGESCVPDAGTSVSPEVSQIVR